MKNVLITGGCGFIGSNFIKHLFEDSSGYYPIILDSLTYAGNKNNLDDDEYYRGIATCKCLFYHSIEERHLHYHPLEAIVIGIPIIFFEQSLLSSYLANSEGRCKNIDE